jgi:hypothetical protein
MAFILPLAYASSISFRSFNVGQLPCQPVEVTDPSFTIENSLLLSVSPFFWRFSARRSSLRAELPARLCLFLEPAPLPSAQRLFPPLFKTLWAPPTSPPIWSPTVFAWRFKLTASLSSGRAPTCCRLEHLS